jgi:hypothetical protein
MRFRGVFMNQSWPTREEDLQTARVIMEQYANDRDSNALGLFEIVVDQIEKRMNFRLSGWILILAKHFVTSYGADQGDYVTRQVISRCIMQDATVH